MSELNKAIQALIDKDRYKDDRSEGWAKRIREVVTHYATALELAPIDVFKAMEAKRTYWYPNYYQWANFPQLDKVRIFQTSDEALYEIQPSKGFRCPACGGISKDPYTCDTGLEMSKGKICDWKTYGLFGTLNKGLRFLILESWIDNPVVDSCFMPVAFEGAEG